MLSNLQKGAASSMILMLGLAAVKQTWCGIALRFVTFTGISEAGSFTLAAGLGFTLTTCQNPMYSPLQRSGVVAKNPDLGIFTKDTMLLASLPYCIRSLALQRFLPFSAW